MDHDPKMDDMDEADLGKLRFNLLSLIIPLKTCLIHVTRTVFVQIDIPILVSIRTTLRYKVYQSTCP